MRSTRGFLGGAAAALLLLAGGNQAQAAWNNVFQVCCHNCRSSSSYSIAAPAITSYSVPTNCCPSVSYCQRCYYQPVTTYKTTTYLEPVTSYRTSYFWEPVCSYRSSCYYDPCTGQSTQVTTPVTSYRLRSQCNAVTSYVQRCALVPVTEMRKACYLEPVVNPCPSCPTAPAMAVPGATAPVAPALPATPAAPSNPGNNGLLPPINVEEAPASGSSYRQPGLEPPVAPPSRPMQPADQTRFDRMTSLTGSSAIVRGTVVASNLSTRIPGSTIYFVNRQNRKEQVAVTTDSAGRFTAQVPAGAWDVYAPGQSGRSEWHSSIDIQPNTPRDFTVVTR